MKTAICAIQAMDTGRFLFARSDSSSEWQWPVSTDRYQSMNDILWHCEALVGFEPQTINSFVPVKDYLTTMLWHVWVPTERVSTSTDPDLVAWHHLYDFPEQMECTISEAIDDPVFFSHCLNPPR